MRNTEINISPENSIRLWWELLLPVNEKVQLLLDMLSLTQVQFWALTWIPSWTIATICRRKTTSQAVNILLDDFLARTAVDRYLLERTRNRVFLTLKWDR